MKYAYRHILVSILLLNIVASPAHAKDPKNISTKLGPDSTHFTLSVPNKHVLHRGETFNAVIHITPGKGWRIWSSKMSDEGGLIPLKVMVPDSLAKYFALKSFRETGDIVTSYDSNFYFAPVAHLTPFDVIATIKVKHRSPIALPFSLLVLFQTVDSQYCMPPRTFAVPMTVIAQKPVMLRLASTEATYRYPIDLAVLGGLR